MTLTKTSHAALAATLVISLALAGCLEDTGSGPEGPTVVGEPTGEHRGQGEMWVVWIHGNQTLSPDPGYACDVAFDHQVLPDSQRILYEDSTYSFEPSTVEQIVATDLWERPTSCPIAYTLQWEGDQATPGMGAWGNLTLAWQEDGAILLDGQTRVAPGQTAIYTYQTSQERDGEPRMIEGTFRVEHLGAWPQDGLEPT